MKITDMLRFAAERGEPVFSFEFFPPKNDAGVSGLFETLRALRPLAPSFVSVTWGAGGSSRGRTLEMVTRIKRETEIEAMAHLTCVGASRKELEEQLAVICDAGITNVLALRGDPPRGQREFIVHPEGLAHSNDLVKLAREVANARGVDLCIGGACYPEGHPEMRDLSQDLRHCKLKVEAGADFLITQLFFDTAVTSSSSGARAPRGSTCRSSPASCRSPTSTRSSGSPPSAARTFRPVSPLRCGRGATIRTQPCSSGSPTPRCRARICSGPARRGSISTR